MASAAARRFDARYRELRDAGAPGWGGERFERRLEGWRTTLDRLAHQELLPAPGARVLELGSGTGMVSRLLAARGYGVTGVELSETAVGWARELTAPEVRFHVGDASDLGRWQARSHDLVVDANCLHCLMDGPRRRCLAEVRRVLRPGGAFLVSSMVGPPGELPDGWEHAEGRLWRDGVALRQLHSADGLVGELVEAGFVEAFRHRSHNPWWDHLTLWMVAP